MIEQFFFKKTHTSHTYTENYTEREKGREKKGERKRETESYNSIKFPC